MPINEYRWTVQPELKATDYGPYMVLTYPGLQLYRRFLRITFVSFCLGVIKWTSKLLHVSNGTIIWLILTKLFEKTKWCENEFLRKLISLQGLSSWSAASNLYNHNPQQVFCNDWEFSIELFHWKWLLLELSGSLFSGKSCQKIKIKRSFKSFFHRDQHFSIYKEKFCDLMLL